MSNFMEDRSWMYFRQHPGGGLTRQFKEGVEQFLNYAYSHLDDILNEKIVCPCTVCRTRYFKDRDTVVKHLYKKGFVEGYYVWIYHGERNNVNLCDVAGTSNDNLPDTVNNFNEIFSDLAQGFTEMNAEPSEPLHVNVVCPEQPNPQAKAFYEMLQAANEELYIGYNKISPLAAAAELLQIKADTKSSIETHNAYVRFTNKLLPENNNLPSTFREAEQLLKKLGMGKVKIDACPNDCMLYYKETKHLVQCPTCLTNRYVDVDDGCSSRRRTPRKILRYMPLAPRLQRLYMSRKTSSYMTWHHDSPKTVGVMTHPCHGEAWQAFDDSFPDFASDGRNVRIGLCTDGFTPFGVSARSYSIWPVMIVVYNLPPWLCMTRPYIYMPLLIPGRNSPGQNIDVYLRPLIDELKMLWCDGLLTWDATNNQNFVMRVALMWTIGDFPAYGMLSGWSTHGKLACPICMENTKSFTLGFGGKPCWFDCHRRHLSQNHILRFESDSFKKNTIETSYPPSRLDGSIVFGRMLSLPVNRFGPFLKGKERYFGFGVTHNWRKQSIFWELPYWSVLRIRHVLDVMHIEKFFFDNLLYTSIGSNDKRNKDDVKARKDLEVICSRQALHLKQHGHRLLKPRANYTLSSDNVRILCAWLKTVRFPDGFASTISNCVKQDCSGIEGLKSHDCHVFIQRLMPIALRGFIPDNLWKTICELSTFFKDLTSPTLYLTRIYELEEDISFILCKLEKVYPPGFFDSMEHLTVHLPEEARLCGPTCFRWMYPFERFIGDLKHKCKNRALPEASICEEYLRHELSNFMSMYFADDITSVHNRPHVYNEGPRRGDDGCLAIFAHPGCSFRSKGRVAQVSVEQLQIAHTYLLLNSPEVSPLVEKFDAQIMHGRGSRARLRLPQYRDTHFSGWLRKLCSNVEVGIVDPRIMTISYGPSGFVRHFQGYKTNGLKFRTRQCDISKRTMHSGICVKGAIYAGNELDYYGLLEDILELTYGSNTVVIFECLWFGTKFETDIRLVNGLVEVNITSRLQSRDIYILASQAQQVYYISYPPLSEARANWVVAVKVQPRRSFYAHVERNNPTDEVYMDDDHRTTGARVQLSDVVSLTNLHCHADEVAQTDLLTIYATHERELSDYEIDDDDDHDIDYEDSSDSSKDDVDDADDSDYDVHACD